VAPERLGGKGKDGKNGDGEGMGRKGLDGRFSPQIYNSNHATLGHLDTFIILVTYLLVFRLSLLHSPDQPSSH